MLSTLRLHFHQSDSFNALTFSSPSPTTDFQYHFTVDQISGIPVFTLSTNSIYIMFPLTFTSPIIDLLLNSALKSLDYAISLVDLPTHYLDSGVPN